nr:hypothetical protein [Tanacetum cinerariifolium]
EEDPISGTSSGIRACKNMLFHYKACLSHVEELKKLKNEKEGLKSKLTGESTISISSKPEIKFVKAAERLITNKVETVNKSTVKYAELYRKSSKKSNNNNTHQSMPPRPTIHRVDRSSLRINTSNMNAAKPKWASFYKPSHLYVSRPFQGRSAARTQPRVPTVNKSFPTFDSKSSTAARRVNTATPRPNVNSARPRTTQDLMIILIQRVKRLEKELKERTPSTKIHKVDRRRSRFKSCTSSLEEDCWDQGTFNSRNLIADASSSLGEDCSDLRAFNSRNLIADEASSLGEDYWE